MQPRYYTHRRLNPYRGVVQIIEVEDAMAHSYDGLTWHLRADDGYGWVRPIGVWLEGEGLKAGVRLPDALRAALETHPPLPFALADQCELWLLDKERGLPLALLGASLPSRHRHERIDPEWQPFVLTYTGFRSPTLARRDLAGHGGDDRHRDWLARTVNNAARPYPAAQWFRRQADGIGAGLGGLRLEKDWQGRTLAADAFPELPVRSAWNTPLEQSVICDYHMHLAPLLLLLPGLADATREALEAAACQQPHRLARVHRLIPRVLRPERLNAALVAARLEAAMGQPEDSLLDS
ncbi:MAG: hypothetical protein MUC79_03355 [Thiobacillaceae bacterium]|jgi:hypothetical protein|nr:hypothetical protein [Thiobacillaceae bacterium]